VPVVVSEVVVVDVVKVFLKVTRIERMASVVVVFWTVRRIER
jgi:hypothetical protein